MNEIALNPENRIKLNLKHLGNLAMIQYFNLNNKYFFFFILTNHKIVCKEKNQNSQNYGRKIGNLKINSDLNGIEFLESFISLNKATTIHIKCYQRIHIVYSFLPMKIAISLNSCFFLLPQLFK